MKNLKIIFGLCIFLVFPGLLSAQSEEEIKQTYIDFVTQLAELPNQYYEARMYYFENNSKNPSDSMFCTYQKSGSMEYMRMGEVESISDNKKSLFIDHEEKALVLKEKADGAELSNSQAQWINLFLSDTTARITLLHPPHRSTLRIESDMEQFSAMEMIFSPEKMWIEKIRLEIPRNDDLTESGVLVIDYFNQNNAPKKFNHSFSQFVRSNGEPATVYKSYQTL